jgi:hypothetical protein
MMYVFDMDGTIADLYGVENWLYELEHYIARPYKVARPMWNMARLAELLKASGAKIVVVSWLSKGSNKQYDEEVRNAKIEWLKANGFPFDKFHGVKYGTTKASVVRRYLAEDELAVLIDDNAKVRKGWSLGETVNPLETDLIEYFERVAG